MSTLDAASGEIVPDNAVQPFPNPGETALAHATEAAGYIERQYRDATRLQATIAGVSARAQTLENLLVSIPPLDDPTIATGNAADPIGTPGPLDVTGDLVGQSRVLSDGTIAPDAKYRTYIGMRIIRNSAHGTDAEFITALRAFFQAATPSPIAFHYHNIGHMTIVIEVGTGGSGGGPPDSDTVALLDGGPVPRAMAVGVLRDWYDPAEYFAFDEDTSAGAAGFGEIGAPSEGGGMAEIF